MNINMVINFGRRSLRHSVVVNRATMVIWCVMVAGYFDMQTASGTFVSEPDLQEQIEKSDLVFVGVVKSVSEKDDGFPVITGKAIFQIRQMIKGPRLAGLEVPYSIPAGTPTMVEILPKKQVVGFVVKRGGAYEFVDIHYPVIDLGEKQLEINDTKGITPLDIVVDYMIRSLDESAPERTAQCVQFLMPIKDVRVNRVLKQLSESKCLRLKAFAFSKLLEIHDDSCLREAVDLVMREFKLHPKGNPPEISVDELLDVVCSINYVEDPTRSSEMLRLLDVDHPTVRWSITRTLVRLKSQELIPRLITELDGKTAEARYQALIDLAVVTGKTSFAASSRAADPQYVPTKDAFLQNESVYISRWKKWWNDQKRE